MRFFEFFRNAKKQTRTIPSHTWGLDRADWYLEALRRPNLVGEEFDRLCAMARAELPLDPPFVHGCLRRVMPFNPLGGRWGPILGLRWTHPAVDDAGEIVNAGVHVITLPWDRCPLFIWWLSVSPTWIAIEALHIPIASEFGPFSTADIVRKEIPMNAGEDAWVRAALELLQERGVERDHAILNFRDKLHWCDGR